MSREAARHPFDLIFFPAVYSYFPLLPGRRARTVVTFHDTIAERHPGLVFPTRRSRLFWMAKCRLALRQADVILTVSEYSKQCLMRHWKLDAGRIRLVSEAAGPCFRPVQESSRTERALEALGLDSSVPYLMYVGGFSPHKNLSFLLQSFCRLTERPPWREVRLLLAGDFAEDVFYSNYPELRQRFRSPNVVFTGHLSDESLAALLSGARALVLPSLDEGFGLPAVEAMSCGTPVLASRSGALPEVVGEAGLYFSPHDQQELLQALLRILDDAPLRRRLSGRALQRAKQFSWDRAAAMARQAFEEAVAL